MQVENCLALSVEHAKELAVIPPCHRFEPGGIAEQVIVVGGEDQGAGLLQLSDRVQCGRPAWCGFKTADRLGKPRGVVRPVERAEGFAMLSAWPSTSSRSKVDVNAFRISVRLAFAVSSLFQVPETRSV
ncbi:MAG: hypothetical protein U1E43_05705 [Rhodospirillales bacterium]